MVIFKKKKKEIEDIKAQLQIHLLNNNEIISNMKIQVNALSEKVDKINAYNEELEAQLSKLREEYNLQKKKIENAKSYEEIVDEWLNGDRKAEVSNE